jgi:hypothetical protein
MSPTVITPSRPAALPFGANRFLAAGLAAVVLAGGAALAFSGDDPVTPMKPNGASSPPMIFGDPPVAKGARGEKTNEVTPPVFGDPTVRKGVRRP